MKEHSPIRQRLLNQNLFIELTDDLLSNDIMNRFLEETSMKFAHIQKIYSILSTVILEDPTGWKPINPNIKLLEEGDEAETKRVIIEISKRKFQMQTALTDEVSYEQTNGKYEITFRGQKAEVSSDVLTTLLSQSKVTQEIIWGWIRTIGKNEGGVLAVGTDPKRVSKKDFRVLAPLDNQPSESDLHSLSWSVIRQLAREAKYSLTLQEEQEGIEIPRDRFVWASNPLISEFRSVARPIVLQHLAEHQECGVTEFDLVTQVMMHLATYEPSEVWIGDKQLIDEVAQLISVEEGEKANNIFLEALNSERVWLNEDLAHYECSRQVKKLADHYSSLSVNVDGEEISLPAEYMGNPENNPFKEFPRTEISAKNRKYETDPITGEKVMIVEEKSISYF